MYINGNWYFCICSGDLNDEDIKKGKINRQHEDKM